jgi:hypothetical protein
MMKGIWFDEVHSYMDLNLILSEVNIPPATAKTSYVDIPGGDGSVDLTEALGEVKFKDRDCSFTFTVFPYEDFEAKKQEISNLLNGKRCKVTLDKDPDYYWVGRCFINGYASDKNLHKITVKATVGPYKLKTKQTTVTVPAGESVATKLENGRKSVVPTITATENAKIVFDGNTYNLGAGTHTILNIELKYGQNSIIVTSNSPVRFTYQEGDL